MTAKTPIGTHPADADTAESAAIFRRYAAKLEAIAAFDRAYYANFFRRVLFDVPRTINGRRFWNECGFG